VDIDPNGKGCNGDKPVWENDDVASTVSARLSTRTGLIYTVARAMDSNNLDVYYWTAIDWRTGEVVWQKMAGTGFGYDSWYPALLIGPDGTMYSGTYGGLIAIGESH
jgi:hypothetical protein